jgi:hypothetical protein
MKADLLDFAIGQLRAALVVSAIAVVVFLANCSPRPRACADPRDCRRAPAIEPHRE